MYKILISSAGSRVGQSLVDSLAPLRQNLRIIGTNSTAMAANLYACDKAYLVPTSSDTDAFKACLKQIIFDESPDLVLAARDQELHLLAELSQDPLLSKTRILVPSGHLCALFNDKYQTYLFAQKYNLPFAASAFFKDELEVLIQEYGFPILAKPRWGGHASKDVYLLENSTQAFHLLAEQKFLFQAFLNPITLQGKRPDFERHGIPWAFSFKDQKYVSEMLLGKQGDVFSMSSNCSEEDGEAGSKVWKTIDSPKVESVALSYAKILGSLGYLGPLNLQGKCLENGAFIPFELNARFTGSTIARTRMDYNQVLQIVNYFLGEQRPYQAHRDSSNSFVIRKSQNYDRVFQKDIDRLNTHKQWP